MSGEFPASQTPEKPNLYREMSTAELERCVEFAAWEGDDFEAAQKYADALRRRKEKKEAATNPDYLGYTSPDFIRELYDKGVKNVTAHDIQQAINQLSPHSKYAIFEAEEVTGLAEALARLHPDDAAVNEVNERALKIFHHRTALKDSRNSSKNSL